MLRKSQIKRWLNDEEINEKIYAMSLDLCIFLNDDIEEKVISHSLSVDKNKFINNFVNVLHKLINIDYTAELSDVKFSWYPEFIQIDDSNKKIISFLNKHFEEKHIYKGKINITDINDFIEFISIFIDCPEKYSYQDIFISNKDSNIVIIFSYHGDMWLLFDDVNLFKKITCELKNVDLLEYFSIITQDV